jgi:hypothetical protein
LKRLKFTHINLIKVFCEARTVAVAAAANEFNLDAGWSKTSYSKLFDADKERSTATDFDHLKIMVL